MTTPGAIKRYIGTSWAMEGSFILQAPTLADLPAAPDDDDVFAYCHANGILYKSLGGAWVAFVGQTATLLNERCWMSANTAVSATGFVKMPFNTPQAGSVNFNTSLNRWVAPSAGTYEVWAAVGIQTVASTNYRFMCAIYVNGTEFSRGSDYTTGTTTSNGGQCIVNDTVTLNAGDYVEIWGYLQVTNASVTWLAAHSTTYFAVRALATNVSIGPPGPSGLGFTVPFHMPTTAQTAYIPPVLRQYWFSNALTATKLDLASCTQVRLVVRIQSVAATAGNAGLIASLRGSTINPKSAYTDADWTGMVGLANMNTTYTTFDTGWQSIPAPLRVNNLNVCLCSETGDSATAIQHGAINGYFR